MQGLLTDVFFLKTTAGLALLAFASLAVYCWTLKRKLKNFFSLGQKLELDFNAKLGELHDSRQQLKYVKSELDQTQNNYAKVDTAFHDLQRRFVETEQRLLANLESEKKRLAESELHRENLLQQADALTAQLKETVIEKQLILVEQRKRDEASREKRDEEILGLKKEIKNIESEVARKIVEIETQKILFTDARTHLDAEAAKKIKRYNELYLSMRNLRELAEDKADQVTTVGVKLAEWILKKTATSQTQEANASVSSKSGASYGAGMDNRSPHLILIAALEAAGIKAADEFSAAELYQQGNHPEDTHKDRSAL